MVLDEHPALLASAVRRMARVDRPRRCGTSGIPERPRRRRPARLGHRARTAEIAFSAGSRLPEPVAPGTAGNSSPLTSDRWASSFHAALGRAFGTFSFAADPWPGRGLFSLRWIALRCAPAKGGLILA